MDGAEVGVLEQSHQVSLGGFLQSKYCGRLKPKILFEVLGNLADQTLEGQLADQEVGRLLVCADLAEGDGSWAVAVGLLDAADTPDAGGLAGGLGGELVAGGLASGVFAGGLLGSSHLYLKTRDKRGGGGGGVVGGG